MGNGDLSSSATSKFRSNVKNEGSSKVWTNERHVDYLNSMEASFVRSMLNSLPKNRDVPDGSDSTLDHRTTPRARRYSTSGTNITSSRIRKISINDFFSCTNIYIIFIISTNFFIFINHLNFEKLTVSCRTCI